MAVWLHAWPCLPAPFIANHPHTHNVLSSSMATNCVLCALVVCDVTPSFVLLLHVCCWVVVCVCVCSDNELGAEGAKALAPSVAKLTQLQTLDLGGEWSVFDALCACVYAQGTSLMQKELRHWRPLWPS